MKRLIIALLCLIQVAVLNEAMPQESRAIRGIRTIKIPDEQGRQVELYNQSHALVIGVSDYTSGWPRLPGIDRDIRRVRTTLEKHGFRVETVINPDRERLEIVFNDFIARYGRDSENRLLFYFAGHGHTLKLPDGREMGYIVPVEAANPNTNRDAFLNKAIDMYQIEGYARRILSKHALFLFDCCFSGSIFSLSRAVPDVISYKTALPVRQFITSGSADEKVSDESIFNRQFVSALEGEGDLNGDGFVTGAELGQFLQDKVINYSRNTQHPQYGKIRDPNLDKGDFVFQLPRAVEVESEYVPPSTPGQSEFSLEDIERKAAEIEAAKTAWAENFNQMKQAVVKVEDIEKLDLPASDKAIAWQRFKDAYGEDNPYSAEDDRLRTRADERLRYWRAYRPPEKEVSEYYVPGAAREVAGVPGLRMVPIPAGSFLMGSNDGLDFEKSVDRMSVDAFEMSATEITQAQWWAVMGNNPSHFKGVDLPVEMVSWNEAMEFCRKLSQKTGQRFDLPTEAEWEYACRAGTSTKYYNGDSESDLARVAWYAGNSGNRRHPVGHKEPNAWGLHDMHGNVSEWCRDNVGYSHVLRGGGWTSDASGCRSASRGSYSANNRYYFLGFRVVCR